MRRYERGKIEIRIPINETTDVPFYRLMALLEGERVRGAGLRGKLELRTALMIDEGGYRDLDARGRG
ncbi:MAG TPA: hypothetical protein VEB59_00185 [Gemmatimonadales bacterium]|nr:hypothetical protein [Gemmatimonadales bacterium]